MSDANPPDLRRDYYNSLRQEIIEVKARLTRLIVLGLVGAPILSYFALTSESQVNVVLIISPLLILLLMVQYFSEQTSMMRAGKFLHDRIEGKDGWEEWVGELRKTQSDPPVFGLFVIVSFGYFILMSSFVFEHIMSLSPQELGVFIYFVCTIALPTIYGVSMVWILITLVRFWHGAFRTD